MRFSWLNLYQLDFLSLFSYFWLGTLSRCYRATIQVSFRRSLILLLWWRSSFQSREDFYNVPIQNFVALEWFLHAYLLALAVDQGWVVWDCEVLSYKPFDFFGWPFFACFYLSGIILWVFTLLGLLFYVSSYSSWRSSSAFLWFFLTSFILSSVGFTVLSS